MKNHQNLHGWKSVSKHWHQFFPIHGVKNHYVPLVFCLLPVKKEETQGKLFDLLRKLCSSFHHALNLPGTVTDFKIDLPSGINNYWQLLSH